jgi:argininosuccinate synthase
MRNLDIADTRQKLSIYQNTGLLDSSTAVSLPLLGKDEK